MKRQLKKNFDTTNFDSTLRLHKRSRLTHKSYHGDTLLITPFVKYKDVICKLSIAAPSIDIQNLLIEHFNRLDKLFGANNHPKAKLVEQHGHPFFNQQCIICKKHHYTYMFTCQDNRCSACRNIIDRQRHQIDYTSVQKLVINDAVGQMLDEAWSIYGFNERAFRIQFNRLLNKGHSRLVNLVLNKGVTYQHVCNNCFKGFYLYDAHIDPKTKLGLRPCCKHCTTAKRNQATKKAIQMNARFSGEVDGYSIIQSRLALQKNQCYYTFIEMNEIKGSPWMYSPERLDRKKTYDNDDNVVLCCEVFNVGGAMNFTRKLVLQIFFGYSFPVFYGFLNKVPIKWVSMCLSAAKSRSKKRKSKTCRDDNSFKFDIDKTYLLNIAKIQNFRCAISGIPLVFQSHHPWLASLDRIDPSQGYVKGNVRWVISRLNSRHTWGEDMINTLMTNLDLTIERVWEAYWGENRPKFGTYISNLAEIPPDY